MLKWIIIIIIVVLVVRHFKKKNAADSAPQQTPEQPVAPKAEPVMTKPAAPKIEPAAPVQPKAEAPVTPPTQTQPVKTDSAPAGSFSPAPASAIEGLDYMDVRKYTDDAKRVPLMMAFAEAGDELAQYEVGQMYVMGLCGVEKDFVKGKELLYKAGYGGATNAIALLGQVCIKQALDSIAEGERQGLPKEEIGARFNAYYDEGADALAWGISTGNELAMDTLTGRLEMGWNQGQLAGTLVNATTQALAPRLEELKAKDDGRSNYVLGMIALRGVCMPQDVALAKSYFQRGAELGDYNAREELKNPLFVLEDDEDDDE